MTAMQVPAANKVVRIEEFGGPEVLHGAIVPVPVPGPGELLVKVAAAGVNPVDSKIRAGKYPAVQRDKLPYILGRDVSGTVVQCGPSTSHLAEGTKIFAMPGIDRGGYAEYVVVKESEMAPKPGSLDFIEAGGVPLAALTAWQGLFKYAELEKGQRILIHGGSGGVGHFAIQFAKVKGAYVTTTVSGRHAQFVRGLGADVVVDHEKQRFEDETEEVDVVFDLVDGETQERSWQVLKRGGVLVSTLKEPSRERAAERGARACRYTTQESGADLTEIGRLIDAGKVKVVVAKTFPLEEAALAQEFLEQEHPAGKVVLRLV
jgi:NADPH:quinone reductase-like Zn-dependent oxidoreductase